MCKCCKMSKMEGELTNKVVWKNNLQKITQDESLNKSCTERQFVGPWLHPLLCTLRKTQEKTLLSFLTQDDGIDKNPDSNENPNGWYNLLLNIPPASFFLFHLECAFALQPPKKLRLCATHTQTHHTHTQHTKHTHTHLWQNMYIQNYNEWMSKPKNHSSILTQHPV